MNRPSLSFVHPLVIPAGGVRAISSEGDFFLVVNSPSPIEISRTGAPRQRYEQGDSEECKDAPFTRLEVWNPTTETIRVEIFVGFSRRYQNRQQVIEPKTRVSGGTLNLAGNTGFIIPGDRRPSDIQRKGVICSNGDGSNLRIQLRDPEGNPFAIILPGETSAVPVSEVVEVFNPNPTAVSIYWGSVFWTS